MLRLNLVDDHRLFRQGLRTIVELQSDLRVVGEAGDAREAYAVAQSTHPDVVLLDVSLPGIDGIAAARELRTREPQARLLMLSMHSDEEHIARALGAGAIGYACKAQPFAEVLEAIRMTGRGESYLPPRASRVVIDDLLRCEEKHGDDPLAPLSNREREVFGLLAQGLSNQSIARQLCISVKTVETHRARVLRNLHLHSMADLVRFAARHALLPQ
jgi:two-component system response regulator NreC